MGCGRRLRSARGRLLQMSRPSPCRHCERAQVGPQLNPASHLPQQVSGRIVRSHLPHGIEESHHACGREGGRGASARCRDTLCRGWLHKPWRGRCMQLTQGSCSPTPAVRPSRGQETKGYSNGGGWLTLLAQPCTVLALLARLRQEDGRRDLRQGAGNRSEHPWSVGQRIRIQGKTIPYPGPRNSLAGQPQQSSTRLLAGSRG